MIAMEILRKLNVHKMFRKTARMPERIVSVQLTSGAQGDSVRKNEVFHCGFLQ